jgi:hypothetical protein
MSENVLHIPVRQLPSMLVCMCGVLPGFLQEINKNPATIDLKELPAGEEARYTAEFTPKEMGSYTIYPYVFGDG